jgi:hypothetical protein
MSNARQGSTKSPIDYATNSNWPNSLRTSALCSLLLTENFMPKAKPATHGALRSV